MAHSTHHLHEERMATCTPALQPRVRVIRKYHVLVRISHWLNIPLLLGLIVSGISIYWASPVYQHNPNPQTGVFDYFADVGIWICAHLPGLRDNANPPDWVYNHVSLGPYMLAPAMRLHWCCAYLFMLNGLVYLTGVFGGGGWRSLLPRLSDARGALRMAGYYSQTPLMMFQRAHRQLSLVQSSLVKTGEIRSHRQHNRRLFGQQRAGGDGAVAWHGWIL